ncbi:MAG: HEAT repeat domain-containing protein, partial [Bacteroidota bacterium]
MHRLLFAALLVPAFVFGQRPADGLLDTPALQVLVEAQTQRDTEPLVRALANPDAAVRARAAFALGSVQDSMAVPALLNATLDVDPNVRADAAFALGQTPAGELVREVSNALYRLCLPGPAPDGAVDEPVCREALHALGKQGDFLALADLLTLDLPPALEPDGLLAIGRFGIRDVHHAQAVRRVAASLVDVRPEVREQAAYYFGRSASQEAWEPVQPAVRAALAAYPLDEPAAAHLLRGLGQLGLEQDAPLLARWLDQGSTWHLRVNAARALQPIAHMPEAWPALIDALTDPHPHPSVAAAEALAGADSLPPPALDALEALPPQPWRVEDHILTALAVAGRDARVLTSFDKLRPINTYEATVGYRALSYIDDPLALEWLAAGVEDPRRRVAYTALNALAERWEDDRFDPRLRQRYYRIFLKGLEREGMAVPYTAVGLLADSVLAPLGSLERLAEAYDTWSVPDQADAMARTVDVLAATGEMRYFPLAQSAATSSDPILRGAGRQAMQTLGEDPGPEPAAEVPEIDWDYLRSLGPSPTMEFNTGRGSFVAVLD